LNYGHSLKNPEVRKNKGGIFVFPFSKTFKKCNLPCLFDPNQSILHIISIFLFLTFLPLLSLSSFMFLYNLLICVSACFFLLLFSTIFVFLCLALCFYFLSIYVSLSFFSFPLSAFLSVSLSSSSFCLFAGLSCHQMNCNNDIASFKELV